MTDFEKLQEIVNEQTQKQSAFFSTTGSDFTPQLYETND